MFEIKFKGRVRGPISDGRMDRWAAEYSHDVASAIADSAKDTWLHNLDSRIRHQTPYYTTQIRKKELSSTRYEIHDSGVLYGPWLESGEYTPRTRFPGYFSQLDAKAEMKTKRGAIARRILRRYRAQGKLI